MKTRAGIKCSGCGGWVYDGSDDDSKCFSCRLPERLARLEEAVLVNSGMIQATDRRLEELAALVTKLSDATASAFERIVK